MTDQSRLIGGRYVLEKLIGEGGTGEVWRARHVTLQSPVAIKLLHGSAAFRESTRKRFLTEARVAAQLNTRHAVKVFDFGVSEQGRPYLIMELLDGESLAERLARTGKLTAYKTARILRLAARALDKAHALGVVHRDFKPENIFLVRGDEGPDDVKVVDFGIAKLMGDLGQGDVEDSSPRSSRGFEQAMVTFTKTGKSVGTPVYMAPEQAKGEVDVGHTADIWAMGVVAYECLTGRRPFAARDMHTLFKHIASCTHAPAHDVNPEVPEAFDTWFEVACNPEPSKRFENASAAALALIDVLDVQSASLSAADADAALSLPPGARTSASDPSLVVTTSTRPSSNAPLVGTSSASARPAGATRAQSRTAWIALFALASVVAVSVVVWRLYLQNQPAAAIPAPTATAQFDTDDSVSSPPPPTAPVASVRHPTEPTSSRAGTTAPERPPAIRTSPVASTAEHRDEGDVRPPPLDGYRDLPSAWPAASQPPPVPTAAPPDSAKPPATKPPPAATPSPFELPELGL